MLQILLQHWYHIIRYIGFKMPFKRIGKTVYVKRNGWRKKGTSSSVLKAKRYLKLLRGIKHGFKPTKRRTRHKK